MSTTTASMASVSRSPAGFVVPLALAGSFIANLGAQFAAAHVAQIQAGLGVSAHAASWITTLHTVAAFFAFSFSPLLARAFGIRRLFLASATLFGVAALLGAAAHHLPVLLTTRIAQGFAGGMFGPIAFVTIFRMWSGPRLPLGFALLALVLLVSFNAGPILSHPIEAAFGWRVLFLAQAVLAIPLLLAGMRWLPSGPLNLAGHKAEWLALGLFAIATGSLVVVFSQGIRHGGLQSGLILAMLLLSFIGWIAFLRTHRRLPAPILDGRKLLDRHFGIPIALNVVFRTSFAVTVSLLPLLLGPAWTGRPASAAWMVLAQLAAFPLVWRWLHHVDRRVPMALGLVSNAVGIAIMGFGGTLATSMVLIGVGQVLFLVPALITGAGSLKPEHGPTATIVFNISTVGGTTLGVGLTSALVAARTAAHATALPAVSEALFLLATVLLLATPLVLRIGRIAPLARLARAETA